MINVTVVRVNQNIISIEADGHSGYADAGSDIVCSAVSTLLQTLIVGLVEVVKIDASCSIDENVAHLSVSIPKDLEKTKMLQAQNLLQTTYLGIKSVQNEYQKFIKIKEK